jgi:ribonuclease BN (tRNA processing enzyme)
MRIFIGGLRGSRPCTGSSYEEFGGDTTSLLLIGSHNERIILDAGTGMYSVAKQLSITEPGQVTILFSHYHLDHIAGLTMNPLFYRADWKFSLVGPVLGQWKVFNAVKGLLGPPYWPISYEKMIAKIEFSDFKADEINLGGLKIRGCMIPHPGGCMAYRIDDTGNDTSMVFATDIEWRKRTMTQEAEFIKMCIEPKPADLLIMDAHFAGKDAKQFDGWGHSCREDVIETAISAGVKKVLLGHHAPEADDTTLHDVEQNAKKNMPGAVVGRAGQWLTIGD